MNITLTGGTGFIGGRLVRRLLSSSHSVHLLVRPGKTGIRSGTRVSIWDAAQGEPPAESLAEADAVIHLAGVPVAQRWTPEAKRRIRSSRVEGSNNLAAGLKRLERRPKVLISASAIGYYGPRGEEALSESSPPGQGFLPEVSVAWENAASRAEELGVRVVRLRIGIVLGSEGGALARMLPPFRWALGGRLGPGTQWMSWIHVEDLVSLMLFALEQSTVRGAVNATSPNPVTNAEFTEKLAAVLRRPAILPVPAAALKLLFGEMAEILLDSQRVLPAAALAAGFHFQHPELSAALRNLLA